MFNALKNYFLLLRMDKPIGVYLLLWPSLSALWLASSGVPDLDVIIIFCFGSLLLRSAGVVVNDILDQEIDRKVMRTFNRPIANRSISNIEAWILLILLLISAAFLLLFLNLLSFYLALFCLVLIGTYPLMKRFFFAPQFYLGVCYSMGIFLAFANYQNSFPLSCWLLFLTNFFWVLGYDTVYAISDRKDDLAIKVKSSAIFFQGKELVLLWACYLLLITFLFLIGILNSFSLLYFLILLINISLIIFFMFSTNFNKPSECFLFFKRNNWLGFGIFLSFIVAYI